MRKLRNLLLLSMAAMALSALTASAASATVEVRNSSGQLCGSEADCEVLLDGQMTLTQNGFTKQCNVDMTVRVFESGALDVPAIDAYGDSVICVGAQGPLLDDCQDAGWTGQILAPGDEGFSGENDFDAVFDSCFEAFDFNAPLRFGLDDTTHLNWSLDQQPYAGGGITIHGTGYDGPTTNEDLDITNVE